MKIKVFDLEGDGFNPTKIHCLVSTTGTTFQTTTQYKEMIKDLEEADVLVGHNIIRFDLPILSKLLGINIKAKIVDTLALSWALYPTRYQHGLADWGEDFGVPKPKVDDWENLPIETYIHRCTEDVKINKRLWDKQWTLLKKIYKREEDAWRYIAYLTFKMDMAREQERSGWKVDIGKVMSVSSKMTTEHDAKIAELIKHMPQVADTRKRTKPAKPFKKDGSLSATGERWAKLLKKEGLPKDYHGEVAEIVGWKEPNPGSHDQVKSWLFDLGWKPINFDHKRDGKVVRKIPQVRIDGEDGKELCPSVKKLAAKSEGIQYLEGITVLAHRLSILKGFYKNKNEEGYVQARIQGFANTLRFKHTGIVNLPSVGKPYGEEVRGVLTAPEGYELVGSDMVGIEDRTKQHYIYQYDPDYVEEMNTEGFDPHLDICLVGKLLTLQQVEDHKNKVVDYTSVRRKGKTANYACTYGAKGATVARAAGIPVAEGEELVEIYWQRNWAINAVADNCLVKTVDSQKWLYNPVSKFWYSLRHDKDRFSTLNQGTATYCFDLWVRKVQEKRKQLTAQFHDEIVQCIKKGNRDKAKSLLKGSIGEVNKILKLNVELDIDVQFGNNYAEIH